MTDSMRKAITETDRRRERQATYNIEHNITPESVVRDLDNIMTSVYERDYVNTATQAVKKSDRVFGSKKELESYIASVQKEMKLAAANLDFERAASFRDEIKELRNEDLGVTDS